MLPSSMLTFGAVIDFVAESFLHSSSNFLLAKDVEKSVLLRAIHTPSSFWTVRMFFVDKDPFESVTSPGQRS